MVFAISLFLDHSVVIINAFYSAPVNDSNQAQNFIMKQLDVHVFSAKIILLDSGNQQQFGFGLTSLDNTKLVKAQPVCPKWLILNRFSQID